MALAKRRAWGSRGSGRPWSRKLSSLGLVLPRAVGGAPAAPRVMHHAPPEVGVRAACAALTRHSRTPPTHSSCLIPDAAFSACLASRDTSLGGVPCAAAELPLVIEEGLANLIHAVEEFRAAPGCQVARHSQHGFSSRRELGLIARDPCRALELGQTSQERQATLVEEPRALGATLTLVACPSPRL